MVNWPYIYTTLRNINKRHNSECSSVIITSLHHPPF